MYDTVPSTCNIALAHYKKLLIMAPVGEYSPCKKCSEYSRAKQAPRVDCAVYSYLPLHMVLSRVHNTLGVVLLY